MKLPSFINFGSKKIIMVHGIINNKEYSLHHNVLINNDTTFEEYYETIEDIISLRYDEGYDMDVIELFKIRIWNMDNIENKNIKITKMSRSVSPIMIQKREIHHISPLKNIPKNTKGFLTMDIETMSKDNNNSQIPVLITLQTQNLSQQFLIDDNLNINNLFDKLFDYLVNHFMLQNKMTIFIHNLGGFDGIFIYKYLVEKIDSSLIKCIIDDKNKFIIISVKFQNLEIIFKDSYRIFPCSLNDLCKVFNIPGKLSEYNPEFNNLNLLKDKNSQLFNDFINYAIQDSLSLYNALIQAQKIYFNNYGVDIVSIVSLPSLAMKIFRTKFLNCDIPIPSPMEDLFIRKSYYGGATDIYECYAKDLYYYDVNSLYPYAMCKPMPYEILEKGKNLSLNQLNNFFGFLEVEIECPDSILRPILPFRINGRTIYPTGSTLR